MGTFRKSVSDELASWIAEQSVFFVSTAPLDPSGHVNVSPKGLDTFRLVGPNQAMYLDLTGSGAETIAHLRENGRLTIMFCAFAGNPQTVRLYGQGRVVFPADPAFAGLAEQFGHQPGIRSVIVLDVDKVGSSCGFAVPQMTLVSDRDRLTKWSIAKGEDQMPAYWANKNAASIDGLPSVTG